MITRGPVDPNCYRRGMLREIMRVFTHDSASRPNRMLLMSWLTLGTVLAKVALGGVTLWGVTVTPIDSGMAGVLLAATLGAYVARRNAWGVKVPAEVAK